MGSGGKILQTEEAASQKACPSLDSDHISKAKTLAKEGSWNCGSLLNTQRAPNLEEIQKLFQCWNIHCCYPQGSVLAQS